MTEQLSQKDYELINSYLDQELDRKDVVKFAERMAEDAAVRTEVEELMKVKSMFRELPMAAPPRNYILTRAMAEEARPKPFWQRLFPVFRTAAAFCALLLIFTFVFPFARPSGSAKRSEMSQPMSFDMAAEEAAPFRDEEIVLEDRDFGGGTDSYQALMPSYGTRGGNPRIEYMMRQEEKLSAQNSLKLDPDNPPEGFISVEKAAAQRRKALIGAGAGTGLAVSIAGIFFLKRKRKALEIS